MKFKAYLASIGVILGLSTAPLSATTEIEWWHAMGGPLGEWVTDLTNEFNKSQSEYRVKAVYKGGYAETMNAAIAAFRSRTQPQIVQVYEVGTATMMAAQGAVYPVHKLMEDTGQSFDENNFLSAIKGYYSTVDGNMLSMPFNSSTPVLYYNKDAFEKAGLDVNIPPQTWEDVKRYSEKLKAAGYNCGITAAWQSWTLLENFSAWHNLAVGTKANGMEGFDTEFTFDSPEHIKHISTLAEWQKDGTFSYGGRRDKPQTKFVTGQCAMLLNSSGSYSGIESAAKFNFGVGMLPYWQSIKDQPQNSIIGGATLWVLRGHDSNEYKAVAAFLAFLSQPEVQANSHQRTGYLPVTKAAYELSESQGFYDKHPGKKIAILQLMKNDPTKNSMGLRFGNFAQMRGIINEELELVWSGKKTAEKALKSAVERGNKILRAFEKANQ